MQLLNEHMAASSSPIYGGGPRRGTASTIQHNPAQLHQQMLRVEAQMVFHEAGDKEVAVVITRLNT